MLRRLLVGTVLLSFISLTVIIFSMFDIYDRGITAFEEEETANKEAFLNLFVDDVYKELNILTKAHAYWTLANEAVAANDVEWIAVNLSEYLYEGDFGIDVFYIAKEDGTVVDSFGIGTFDTTKTAIYTTVKEQDSEHNSLIWIDDQVYLLSAMPLANDDLSDKNGVVIFGRALSGDLLIFLESIIEPAHTEHFDFYPSENDALLEKDHVTFTITSMDDDLVLFVHLQYSFTQYIKDQMINRTITIISVMFLINLLGIALGMVAASKYRNQLIDNIDSIQLSEHTFPRIPENKVKEFNNIGVKVNEMLTRIEEGYDTLAHKNLEIVHLLSKANELNDPYTKEHSDSVSKYCEEIGKRLGINDIDQLILSAQLHDVGKVFIPLEVLNKKGALTKLEYDIVKQHPKHGYNILSGLTGFDLINEGVLFHHEHYDGNGYPEGRREEEIPLFARIIAVSDVYDALTSNRPYRNAFTKADALVIMRQQSGKHFDPSILDLFLSYIESTTSEN